MGRGGVEHRLGADQGVVVVGEDRLFLGAEVTEEGAAGAGAAERPNPNPVPNVLRTIAKAWSSWVSTSP
jgi:hypothetical protein